MDLRLGHGKNAHAHEAPQIIKCRRNIFCEEGGARLADAAQRWGGRLGLLQHFVGHGGGLQGRPDLHNKGEMLPAAGSVLAYTWCGGGLHGRPDLRMWDMPRQDAVHCWQLQCTSMHVGGTGCREAFQICVAQKRNVVHAAAALTRVLW